METATVLYCYSSPGRLLLLNWNTHLIKCILSRFTPIVQCTTSFGPSRFLCPTANSIRIQTVYINVPVFCEQTNRTAHQNTQIKICEVLEVLYPCVREHESTSTPPPAPQDCAALCACQRRSSRRGGGSWGGGRRGPGSGRPREPSPRCASGPRCGGLRRRVTKMPPSPAQPRYKFKFLGFEKIRKGSVKGLYIRSKGGGN